ncbi:hypothetical protein PF010_g19127 [Phytophthora fragariae]|nr:hypothetical protein PF003_g29118 [Phytophthora fragariae]KAE8929118.1 hypothetical protein PF009_g20762 [Phytophthora fragariae]KAE8990901.1 hypothetical protein PF011_g18163 [Phytophthora fragariae]KAE9089116.1 hypothetical protein PF010_g19127 [Phytophthora fragariae]KAE9089544.1 hypothetical protein PF007_g19563 [Phytophthora fragariae]
MLVRSSFFSVALSAVFLNSPSNTMPNFVWNVPNGANVPESPAIGHDMSDFPGRNVFGQDFEDAGLEWTKELRETDSDQDGQTNGQELGDPCCLWTTGSSPLWTTGISHPGDATKTSDPSLWTAISCSSASAFESESQSSESDWTG